jgi:hypothetical protein
MARERTCEEADDETKFRLSARSKLNTAPLLGHVKGVSCLIQIVCIRYYFLLKCR